MCSTNTKPQYAGIINQLCYIFDILKLIMKSTKGLVGLLEIKDLFSLLTCTITSYSMQNNCVTFLPTRSSPSKICFPISKQIKKKKKKKDFVSFQIMLGWAQRSTWDCGYILLWPMKRSTQITESWTPTHTLTTEGKLIINWYQIRTNY